MPQQDQTPPAENQADMSKTPAIPTIYTAGFFHAELAEDGRTVRISCLDSKAVGLSGYLVVSSLALEVLAKQLMEMAADVSRPAGGTTQ